MGSGYPGSWSPEDTGANKTPPPTPGWDWWVVVVVEGGDVLSPDFWIRKDQKWIVLLAVSLRYCPTLFEPQGLHSGRGGGGGGRLARLPQLSRA